jgi:hypothetical protein
VRRVLAVRQDHRVRKAKLARRGLLVHRGETGAQGPQGDAGDTGPQGPNGPSEAYVTEKFDFVEFTDRNLTTVAHLDNLPAGTYVLNVSMRLSNFGPSRVIVLCGGNLVPLNAEYIYRRGLGRFRQYR